MLTGKSTQSGRQVHQKPLCGGGLLQSVARGAVEYSISDDRDGENNVMNQSKDESNIWFLGNTGGFPSYQQCNSRVIDRILYFPTQSIKAPVGSTRVERALQTRHMTLTRLKDHVHKFDPYRPSRNAIRGECEHQQMLYFPTQSIKAPVGSAGLERALQAEATTSTKFKERCEQFIALV